MLPGIWMSENSSEMSERDSRMESAPSASTASTAVDPASSTMSTARMRSSITSSTTRILVAAPPEELVTWVAAPFVGGAELRRRTTIRRVRLATICAPDDPGTHDGAFNEGR